MSESEGPIVHVEIYSAHDTTYPERGFHGSLSWVYQQLGRLVMEEQEKATQAEFRAARAAERAAAMLRHPSNLRGVGL